MPLQLLPHHTSQSSKQHTESAREAAGCTPVEQRWSRRETALRPAHTNPACCKRLSRLSSIMTILSDDELQLCRTAFGQFDRDRSGTIDVKELTSALHAMGQHPSEEELFAVIHEVDVDGSGEIDFSEFCSVIVKHKQATATRKSDEADTCDAWVALGGNPDRSGKISTEKLRATIKEFALTLDIDRLLKEVDYDSSGVMDYAEFKRILG